MSKQPKTMSFLDWWKGTQAYALLMARKAEGKPIFTIRSEAERRAAICVECPEHVKPEDVPEAGWAEKWAKGKMRAQIENRNTTLDAKLGICGVCKCENRTIVHMHPELLKVGIGDPKEYPKTCWKLKL